MSINWTLQHLKELEEAIASGVRRVEYNDRTVEYKSTKEMFMARSEIRKCLGLQKKVSRLFCRASKGIC